MYEIHQAISEPAPIGNHCRRKKWPEVFARLRNVGDWFEFPAEQYGAINTARTKYTENGELTIAKHNTKPDTYVVLRNKLPFTGRKNHREF